MNRRKLEKIRKIFERAPVEVVYLFGSQATGEVGPMSDYDFGVLIDPEKKEENPLLLGQLMDRLFSVVGYDKAEVVDLDKKPILFRFKAIKDGQVILNRSESRRVDFEVDTMRRFHDQKYYLDQEIYQVLEEIEKGVFFDRRLLSHHKTA